MAAHRYINSVLFTSPSMKRLMREVAPRFDEMGLKAGFTRIEPLGSRQPDRAKMAAISLMGSPAQQWEDRLDIALAEDLGRDNYWQWELKLLKGEQ